MDMQAQTKFSVHNPGEQPASHGMLAMYLLRVLRRAAAAAPPLMLPRMQRSLALSHLLDALLAGHIAH